MFTVVKELPAQDSTLAYNENENRSTPHIRLPKEIAMHNEFVSLAVIAFMAAVIPMIAQLVPRRIVPETVLLLLAGSLLGPHGLHIIDSHADSIHMLAEMGCALLFLLAGFEIDPKSITGEDGRHGLYTWIVTFILAIGAAMAVPIFAAGREGILATALLLTTTALGTLMPILKERNLMGTRIGDLILSYGTWGEVAVVLCVAIILSTRATWQTAAILGGLFLLCVWIALMGSKSVKDGNALYRFLDSKAGAASQTPVRVTLLLLILLVTFSAVFELDIVLGAFAAGFVLRYIIPAGSHTLETKLEGMAFGFFIPLFFVVSGYAVNLKKVAAMPSYLLIFIAALVLVRSIPIILSLSLRKSTRKEISLHNRTSIALYCTTALPLIVAITGIAVRQHLMHEDVASVLIAAGALTVFLMPFLGSILYHVVDAEPLSAIREILQAPTELPEIFHEHVHLMNKHLKEEQLQHSIWKCNRVKTLKDSLQRIADEKERNMMYNLAARHLREQEALQKQSMQERHNLMVRQYAEMEKLYHAYHAGDVPTLMEWEKLMGYDKAAN